MVNYKDVIDIFTKEGFNVRQTDSLIMIYLPKSFSKYEGEVGIFYKNDNSLLITHLEVLNVCYQSYVKSHYTTFYKKVTKKLLKEVSYSLMNECIMIHRSL